MTLTASGGTSPTDPVGTYVLTPSNATGSDFNSNNYVIQYVDGRLRVMAAPTAIVINSNTNFYYNGSPQGPTNVVVTGSTAPTTYTFASLDGITYPDSANPPTNAGSYTVKIVVPPSATYEPASSAPVSFTINPAPLIITANNQSVIYGTEVSLGAGQTNFTAVGLTNSETIDSVTLNSSGGDPSVAPIGTYALTPSDAIGTNFLAENYTIQYVDGTLSVLAASSTITITGPTNFFYSGSAQGPNKATVIGSTAPAVFTYVSTDGVTYMASINPPTNAGNYTVTASVAANSDYQAATSAPIGFTINTIPLSITANAQTKIYGTTLNLGSGQTNFTATGLTNSETVGSVTLLASGGSSASDAIGDYLLTPSLAVGGTFSASNYNIIYQSGQLQVIPRTTIAATESTDVPLLPPWSVTALVLSFLGLGVWRGDFGKSPNHAVRKTS